METTVTLSQEKSARSSPPFLATLKERTLLNPQSDKQTYHLVLDIQGSGVCYQVGDCVAIYPENDPSYVESLLELWKLPPHTPVPDRNGKLWPLATFLKQRANVQRIPSPLAQQGTFAHLAEALQTHLLPPEHLTPHLAPLLPRFYSIASSMQAVGEQVHLTVGLSVNPPATFFPFGTCSSYLCHNAPLHVPSISLYLHPTQHFFLPPASDAKPLIMIGPGTGIAPFRGFMQERVARNAPGPNWLFFGERRAAHDFYYKDFWEEHCQTGRLRLDCAFSRDHHEKVYVQHKIWEHRHTFWQLIEEGAYIYVCGDAKHMAKEVEATLKRLFQEVGNCSPEEAKNFLKMLNCAGRYRKDVY